MMQSYHVQVFEVRPVKITTAMRTQLEPGVLRARADAVESVPLRELWMMQEGLSAHEAKRAAKPIVLAKLRAIQPRYDLVSISVVEDPQRIKIIVRRK